MKLWKKLALGSVVALSAISLTACGKSSNSNESKSSDKQLTLWVDTARVSWYKGVVKDFEKEHTGGILLSEKGRRTFIEQLEKRMRTTVNHRHLGRNVSYRRLIRLELYKIQKHILGEKPYEPYTSLW